MTSVQECPLASFTGEVIHVFEWNRLEDDLRVGALEVSDLRLILPVGEKCFSFATTLQRVHQAELLLLDFHLIEVVTFGVFRLLHGAANLLRIEDIVFASFLQLLDNLLLLRELPMLKFGDLRANLHMILESWSDLLSAFFARQR